MLVQHDRADLLHEYIVRAIADMRMRYRQEPKHAIQLEPPSAQSVYGYDFRILGFDVNDPVTQKTMVEIIPEFRPETLELLKILRGYGIEPQEVFRGGGGYRAGWPNKKLARYLDQEQALASQAVNYWRRPWWGAPLPGEQATITDIEDASQTSLGRRQFIRMLEDIRDRSLENLVRAEADPELIIGEKRPSTGTGWLSVKSDRAGFARRVRSDKTEIEHTIQQYYADLIEAVGQWPEKGADIYVDGDWVGITAGSRSDADCVSWETSDKRLVIAAAVREVGVDPSSVLHNQTLDGHSYTRTLWEKYTTPITQLPQYRKHWSDLMKCPPVTAEFAKDQTFDRYLLSADFGYSDSLKEMRGGVIQQTQENIKFGADQIWLSGIMLRSNRFMSDLARRSMLISGCPFTMLSYQIQHIGLHEVCQDYSLNHVRVLGVGDDLQVTGPMDELAVLAEALGFALRTKGMAGNRVFITGTYYQWLTPERVFAWQQPRPLKTVVSPQEAMESPDLRRPQYIGMSGHIAVPDTAVREIDRKWRDQKELIYVEASPEELAAMLLDLRYWQLKREMAMHGVSEWLLEVDIVPSEEDPASPDETFVDVPAIEQASEQIVEEEQHAEEPSEGLRPAPEGMFYHFHLPPDFKQIVKLEDSGRSEDDFKMAYERLKGSDKSEDIKKKWWHADWQTEWGDPPVREDDTTEREEVEKEDEQDDNENDRDSSRRNGQVVSVPAEREEDNSSEGDADNVLPEGGPKPQREDVPPNESNSTPEEQGSSEESGVYAGGERRDVRKDVDAS